MAAASKIARKSGSLLHSLPIFLELELNLFCVALLFHTHPPALSCKMLEVMLVRLLQLWLCSTLLPSREQYRRLHLCWVKLLSPQALQRRDWYETPLPQAKERVQAHPNEDLAVVDIFLQKRGESCSGSSGASCGGVGFQAVQIEPYRLPQCRSRLWAVGCGLWTMDCGLWAVGYGLWDMG